MARVVVLAGALLLFAGAVQAPDERANARAFADAIARFVAAGEALPAEPRGELRPCVERVHRRIAEHRWDDLLAFENDDRPFARLVEPLFMRLSTDLHAVETADPALRGGRTAVRRLRRAYAAVAALPRIDVCAEVRRWVRGGFEPTPALRRIRRAQAGLRRASEGEDVDRRVTRMGERMRELGAPLDVADDQGGGQAPAPSSPPTAPRAAS